MSERSKVANGSRPWRFIWIGWQWHFNVHRDDCCVLCFTVGPIGFRWHR